MNGKYLVGAVVGSLIGGIGISALMMAGEKKSGKPSELIELQRATARRLDVPTPSSRHMPTDAEQMSAQGGHLLLSVAAGAVYAAVTDEETNPVIGGAVFGLSFYALAHWLTGPVLKVKAPEWTNDRKTIGMHTVNHILFGLATAFGARAATRL